ncbi:hypothetical protein [Streptomyces sp. NPDC001508]|uniref:hypothetical protein n=1 Tax=Streptomyces sp. NPDC001508 TaxID=3154656 RepID=UPI0033252A57
MTSDGVVVDEVIRAAWDSYRILERRTRRAALDRVNPSPAAVSSYSLRMTSRHLLMRETFDSMAAASEQ